MVAIYLPLLHGQILLDGTYHDRYHVRHAPRDALLRLRLPTSLLSCDKRLHGVRVCKQRHHVFAGVADARLANLEVGGQRNDAREANDSLKDCTRQEEIRSEHTWCTAVAHFDRSLST